MRSRESLNASAFCIAVSIICGLGCAHTVTSESTIIRQAGWRANVNECQEVLLSRGRVIDRREGEADRTYEVLRLELVPRAHLEFETVLEKIELGPTSRGGNFAYEELEVRAGESRRRIWFVDPSAERVVATLDMDTGVTTGPGDEPPAWATVDGGEVLDRVE